MDANETIKTLQDTGERFEGYSVFTVDFNGTPIKMVTLKDAQAMLAVKRKLDGVQNEMNLTKAKALFEKHHPEEAMVIRRETGDGYHFAACIWHGFKSALKVTGQLED